MECAKCVCVWLGAVWEVSGKKNGFGICQSCRNMGSVGRVSELLGMEWVGVLVHIMEWWGGVRRV